MKFNNGDEQIQLPQEEEKEEQIDFEVNLDLLSDSD